MERLKRIGQLGTHPASEIGESRIGIGFEKLDRDIFDPEKAYDKVSAIGVKKIRLQSGWMKTERVRGVYDFLWLDRIVDELLGRGMEPWLCLCYGNPLYTPLAVPVFGAVGCPPIDSEEATTAWLAYVKATVRHFAGRVTLYEIWNEPDCSYSWRHCETEEHDLLRNAREYGLFALATAQAIHAADPHAGTVGFALGHPERLSFVNTALATGLYRELDYLSFHGYSVDDTARARLIGNLRALTEYYNPAIRLIQGESGAQSRSDGAGAMHGYAWTPARQVTQLLRSMLIDLHEEVAFASYFSTMDMVEALHGKLTDRASYLDWGYFGVLSAEFDENGRSTGEYREKPAYHALSALAALFAGEVHRQSFAYVGECLPSRRVGGRDCAAGTVTELGFALPGGRRAFAYWNAVPLLTSTYEGTISYSFFGLDTRRIELVRLSDGAVFTLPDDMVSELPDGGVRFVNLPITHDPMVLVFGGAE